MKIDFKLRRRAILRPIVPTQNQADKLARLYLAIPQVWIDARARILPAYARAINGLVSDDTADVQYQIDETGNSVARAILTFKNLFGNWIFDFSLWHMQKFNANLKYAANVDLTSIVTPQGDTLEAIIARNVSLVTSVSDQVRTSISDIVFRGLSNRTPVEEIGRQIADATGLARDRSRRIASDQLVKAGAALDRSRMQDLGIEQFVWHHSAKLHPRLWHLDRDGKTFRFDDPALVGDMPGEQPFCGCKARGVIDGQ